jgi:rubrerythrin
MHKDLDARTHQRILGSAAKRIERILVSAFKEGSCYEDNDPSRALRLRPSSFPFCPLRFFLDLPDMLTRGKRIDSMMAYYVRVGHVIHHVFQEAISTHAEGAQFFVRDWRCHKCHHIHVLTTLPKQCIKCKAPFKVHQMQANLEHTIEEGNLVGHVDDAFSFNVNGNDYAVIIDYKSTSLARMGRKGVLPERSHLDQLSAYAAMINRKHHVLGYVLIYIPRDNPMKLKVFPFLLKQSEAKQILARIAKYEKQHAQALRASTMPEVKKLIEERPCKDMISFKEFCGEKCKYGSMCTVKNAGAPGASLLNYAQHRLKRLTQIRSKESS